ncbi:RNA 3'-terminal phosphate cyclase [Nematocida parisii ERTm1]|uniref:RNA 3'-terminal phosphate cyclase n=1 Tax=Nematocida parisii (strain ERTm3) TaxID=935791 RepID=I3EIU5_NEMP3|nr:RNA 3'-terminal phosphate cyclase [Nematocida parisii ERTm1]EIJ89142.1 RNA 3'-terminal phosphate cyclase [Nematocida parisii ERTm3]EIJ93305.1 RNA 3'-terminal phosphate cyclase [Nematocida parisii ERTm1]KAI5142878.1 RNA 3'-terminal phosphate cyclase-like protein [Nematocida parisii]|eukprot:XP_013059475.1 RNA 3'-terminal phosphate cyclase [Nematocida parisii ERTm1]
MEISSNEPKIALTLSSICKRTIHLKKQSDDESNNATSEYIQILKKLSAGASIKEERDEYIYTPGTINGGELSFQCVHNTIPDVIIALLPLVPFCRIPIRLTLKGTTNKKEFTSIDMVRAMYCKILSQFGVVAEVKINTRALYPSQNGEVLFMAETATSLSPVILSHREELRRIIGINYSAKINSDTVHTVSNVAREHLSQISSSVKIYNDIGNSKTTSGTPGQGSVLLAFGHNSIYAVEYTVDGTDSLVELTAEERINKLVQVFYKNIRSSGSYSHTVQYFIFILLSLTTVDASSVIIRRISQKDKEVLLLLEKIMKYTYTVEPYIKTEKDINSGIPDNLLVIKSCGVGYTNIFKPIQ